MHQDDRGLNQPHESTDGAERIMMDKSRLETLQRMASVGAVSSSVAHEFNNILMAVLNHAKAGMKTGDVAAKDRAFDKILASARRAAKITTGILALSRNRTSRKETTDIVTLVEELLAVVAKDLEQHRVHVERDFGPIPPVEIVPAQIEQVLMNIIINARQAMPRGGTILLSVKHNVELDMVEISVRDTGTGMDAEVLTHIFDPFYSTKDGPDESGQGGSGLGLSICREIIERHQGRIRVESMVGQGTTFTIKLPVTLVEAPALAS